MIPTVGEYYRSHDLGDILQVTEIKPSGLIIIRVIEDPRGYWRKEERALSTSQDVFRHYYKHLGAYGTPLWKAVNNNE